jgi:glycosyltransferase involved in cell wall biosynthesis
MSQGHSTPLRVDPIRAELTFSDARADIDGLKAECKRLTLQLRDERRRAKADSEWRLEFRIGRVITENRRWPWRWPLIPLLIFLEAYRYRQDQRVSRAMDPTLIAILDNCRQDGAHAAVGAVWQDRSLSQGEKLAQFGNAAAIAENAGDYELRYELLKAVFEQVPTASSTMALIQACEQTSRYREASDLVQALDTSDVSKTPPATTKALKQLKRKALYHLSLLHKIPERRAFQIEPIPNRIVYVLHNSLPHSSGGYATRTHGVATGLKAAGAEVIALTRPGYPLDIKGELQRQSVALKNDVDGIEYHHILENPIKGQTLIPYMEKSVDLLEQRFRDLQPSLVIAASNHRVGLMAMIAARKLGIPFVYEVRGRWEVTKASRDNSYMLSEEFEVQELLENETAKAADHVLTLNAGIKETLVEAGVPADHISLVPNSCDASKFQPQPRDQSLAARYGIPADVPVIGYIGTFVDYEGLDDLARAAVELKRQGIAFRLLIVGNENVSGTETGPIARRIQRLMAEGDASDWLLMPGRVPYAEVAAHYSLLDIAAFPRKPWPVCELVSPMKPLEAMAMQKAVVVSSVRALRDLVAHGETGLVFEKGNSSALADILHQLIKDKSLAADLAKRGRDFVLEHRTWEKSTATVLPSLPFTLEPTEQPNQQRGAA